MSEEIAPDLTESETEELQRSLSALQGELTRALAESLNATRPVQLDEPIGRLSRMDAIQQQKMAQASRQGIALRANQVRAALQRVAEGSYGTCAVCDESVGYARLMARPEAPLCLVCQNGRERR